MTEEQYTVSSRTKYIIIGAVIVLAFFAAYGYASARGRATVSAQSAVPKDAASACGGCDTAGAEQGATSGACTGCDAEAPAVTPQGAATISDGVQRIDVDVSAGYFDPTVIELAAGVPTEITFSEGSGCLAAVRFPDFDIEKDLTGGGAVVSLPALDAGEYGFSCGMDMVFGKLVVH